LSEEEEGGKEEGERRGREGRFKRRKKKRKRKERRGIDANAYRAEVVRPVGAPWDKRREE